MNNININKKLILVLSLSLCMLSLGLAEADLSDPGFELDPDGEGVVAVNSEGQMFVAGTSSVTKYSPDGEEVWKFTESDSVSDIADTFAITTGPAGNVYVSTNPGGIMKISPEGEELWRKSFDEWVEDVAVDSEGYVYTARGDSDTEVVKLSPDGEEKWSYDISADFVQDVAVDSEGNVYASTTPAKIIKISLGGKEEWSYDASFEDMYDVAVGPEGYIYAGGGSVTGPVNVMKITPSGEDVVWSFPYDEINAQVAGLEIDRDGNIFVGYGESTLKKLSSEGSEIDSTSLPDDEVANTDISSPVSGQQYLAVSTSYTNNSVFRWSLEVNQDPRLNNVHWNNSNPEFGDWIQLEANISDPDSGDSVTEAVLETQQGNSTLFSGNGSVAEDGLWVSEPVKVNESEVWYNGSVLSATDSNGATSTFSSGNTASFYLDNPPPQITSAELVDDRRNDDRTLQFGLDDRGQSDISESSGVENIRTFTNSTLITGLQDTSFNSEVTVSDQAGLLSDPFNVDFEVSDSELEPNTSFNADLSQQRVLQELTVTNQDPDTDLNYTQKFEEVNGDNLTDTVAEGVVQPSSSVSNVAGWDGDWITGLQQRSFSKYQSSTYDHSEDSQRLVNRTELVADNALSLEFSNMDISSVCNQTSSTNVLPGDSVSVTTDCNRPTFEVDYIDTEVGEESQDRSRTSGLQTQYLQRKKNVSETGGYGWSSVAINSPSIDGTCSDCSSRERDISAGQRITEVYHSSGDWINQSTSALSADSSYSHDLDSQGVAREKQLIETGGYNWSSINVSAPELPGSCENCGQRKLDVEANSTTSTSYNSTSDWIQERVHNTSYGSGQVIYGGDIEKRFNASQHVYTNNTRSGVGFDVDFTEAVSQGFSNCRLVNDTVQNVAAGHSGNHSFVKSCNPGQEVGYTPVQKTDLGGKYKYNLTSEVKVFSELSSEQEHWIGIPQARLDKWEERNPGDTDAYVDGQSSEVRFEQGVVNGTEYVFIVVSDEFGDSSLHTGEHTATLIYTEGEESSTDTGSPGQIGDPIGEVEGEDYSWGLYNVRSQEQEDVGFSIAGVPGRQFERRLAVRNTGDQSVTIELECVSQGEACDWVETSVDRIQLDTQDHSVSYFDVSGRVPTTAEADDTYRFSIRGSDPSFEESNPSTSGSESADFVVSISPFFGTVIENIQKLLSWRDVEPPEWAPSVAESFSYPFAALPLIASGTIYEFLRRLQRRYDREVTNYDEIWKFAMAFLVFLVVTGIA